VDTVAPQTADAVAAVVADAARDGQRLRIQGSGTKAEWAPVSTADRLLSTVRLNRLIAHRHGDLTATIEAGARLADVNRQLAQQGQMLALDSAWDHATIGGIVATNDSGPRRHRYGAPRDQIIGVEIVRADGVRARAGGIVVKNVAGYDIARLMTGSFGALAVIVSATFKLYPLPAASRTVRVDVPSPGVAAAVVAAMASSPLTPTALEIAAPPLEVLIRFESTVASVEAQSAEAIRLAESCGARASTIGGDDEQRAWQDHVRRPWSGAGAVLKLTLMPSELSAVLEAIDRASSPLAYEVIGRAGLGVVLARIEGDAARQSSIIASLRGRTAGERGSVVVLRGSPELRTTIDPWGARSASFRVMESVKRTFDPQGILNPAGGPGGL
jgi:glycolate oxidase FAD binding subunit